MRQRRWEARSSGQRYIGSATTYTRNEQPDVDLAARSQKLEKSMSYDGRLFARNYVDAPIFSTVSPLSATMYLLAGKLLLTYPRFFAFS